MQNQANDDGLCIRLRDGRILSYRLYGDPKGPPLFVFHGLPGSGRQAALIDAQARSAGACLIAPDRPGYGQSSPAPRRSLLSWADDVGQLADHLGIAQFGLLGISCGGAYALACAQALAERVDYVGLLAGIAPVTTAEVRTDQLPALKLLFALAKVHPGLVAPLLLAERRLLRTRPQQALQALSGMLSEPDRDLLAKDPIAAQQFIGSLVEAYRQGVSAATRDAALIARDWGFDLGQIPVPVHLYQGGRDRHVTPEMGQHLFKCLPRARYRLYPEEGHFSIVVNRFSDCAADFVALSALRSVA